MVCAGGLRLPRGVTKRICAGSIGDAFNTSVPAGTLMVANVPLVDEGPVGPLPLPPPQPIAVAMLAIAHTLPARVSHLVSRTLGDIIL
jgi:hypothetical protein